MLRDIKKDFPIFTRHSELAYLDSAATAQITLKAANEKRSTETLI